MWPPGDILKSTRSWKEAEVGNGKLLLSMVHSSEKRGSEKPVQIYAFRSRFTDRALTRSGMGRVWFREKQRALIQPCVPSNDLSKPKKKTQLVIRPCHVLKSVSLEKRSFHQYSVKLTVILHKVHAHFQRINSSLYGRKSLVKSQINTKNNNNNNNTKLH